MNLSTRATSYLSSLERRAPVPTSRVADELRRQDISPPVGWLEFHDQFAGYVEHLGLDAAVWGLMHPDAQWQDPLKIWVERDTDGTLIACANVHPSYDYWLDESAAFIGIGGGAPCASFGVKVEQNALLWCAGRSRKLRRIFDFDAYIGQRKAEWIAETQKNVVSVASDAYTTCFMAESYVAFRRKNGWTVWELT